MLEHRIVTLASLKDGRRQDLTVHSYFLKFTDDGMLVPGDLSKQPAKQKLGEHQGGQSKLPM